jgi:hypothetical protein
MYFSHAFRKTLLATPTTVGGSTLDAVTSGATSALTAGQVGIFNQAYTAIDFSTVSSSKAPFYIVQGSYYKTAGYSDTIGTHGGYQESVKSKMINPKYITRLFWVQAKAPAQQVVQIPISCGLTCDTTYRLRIDVKGSPALRFLSHNLYRVLDSYTGCCSTTNPGFVKDPAVTIVNWKEQLNASPYFNNMVQARAYKFVVATAATAIGVAATTSQVTITVTNTSMLPGQRIIGGGLPANSFITALVSTTGIVVKYPVQAVAPTVNATATYSTFSDLYAANTVGSPTTAYFGQATYIPGTTIPTGATINTTGSGALIYTGAADAASFTYTAGQEPFLELTSAYVETKFGNATFTVTDNYDVEPLKIIASVVDDSGNPCLTYCIGSTPNIGVAGIATEVQAATQVQGIGETVLRELILTGKYRQEAFGDGVNIDTFRMREIEANPGVLSMMSLANRNALYNKFCILHSVPRFNNPTGVFDNDQYLIEIAVPNTVPITQFFSAATYAAGGTLTATGTAFGDYILEASIAAGGVQYAEMI